MYGSDLQRVLFPITFAAINFICGFEQATKRILKIGNYQLQPLECISCLHVEQIHKRGCDHLPGHASAAVSNPSSSSVIYGLCLKLAHLKVLHGYMSNFKLSYSPSTYLKTSVCNACWE